VVSDKTIDYMNESIRVKDRALCDKCVHQYKGRCMTDKDCPNREPDWRYGAIKEITGEQDENQPEENM